MLLDNVQKIVIVIINTLYNTCSSLSKNQQLTNAVRDLVTSNGKKAYCMQDLC